MKMDIVLACWTISFKTDSPTVLLNVRPAQERNEAAPEKQKKKKRKICAPRRRKFFRRQRETGKKIIMNIDWIASARLITFALPHSDDWVARDPRNHLNMYIRKIVCRSGRSTKRLKISPENWFNSRHCHRACNTTCWNRVQTTSTRCINNVQHAVSDTGRRTFDLHATAGHSCTHATAHSCLVRLKYFFLRN